MLQDWSQLFAPAVQDRICLLLNHVISRESVAMSRLQAHAGRTVTVHLAGWPKLLPAAPDLVLGISRAGLFERLDAAGEDSMRIELDASNPAALALATLSGERPRVNLQGDAALAGDLNWLIQNLRWDVEDDLARVINPAAAHQLARWGGAIAQAFAKLARTAATLAPGGRAGA